MMGEKWPKDAVGMAIGDYKDGEWGKIQTEPPPRGYILPVLCIGSVKKGDLVEVDPNWSLSNGIRGVRTIHNTEMVIPLSSLPEEICEKMKEEGVDASKYSLVINIIDASKFDTEAVYRVIAKIEERGGRI